MVTGDHLFDFVHTGACYVHQEYYLAVRIPSRPPSREWPQERLTIKGV